MIPPDLNTGDLLLAAGLLVACVTDLREGKIPNVLTLPLVVLGVLYNTLSGALLFGLLGAVIAFALHFGLWALKVERGGDAKLMMAVGAFLGWSDMLATTIWMFLLLAPVGILVLIARGRLGNFLETLRYAWRKALGYPVEPPAEQTTMIFAPVIACAVIATRLLDWPASLWS